jgi:nitrite reductase (NADH) large subunit
MNMTEKLIIVGNGMAPGRMLEHLLEQAPGRYQVTIFNAEPRVNYDRIMLSPVLSGEKDYEQIIIHGDGWYIKNNIALYKGHRIVLIDREAKTVTSDHGVIESYDKLVIATGSVPFIPPVPGRELAGVLTYRDLDNVNAMLLATQSRAGVAPVRPDMWQVGTWLADTRWVSGRRVGCGDEPRCSRPSTSRQRPERWPYRGWGSRGHSRA